MSYCWLFSFFDSCPCPSIPLSRKDGEVLCMSFYPEIEDPLPVPIVTSSKRRRHDRDLSSCRRQERSVLLPSLRNRDVFLQKTERCPDPDRPGPKGRDDGRDVEGGPVGTQGPIRIGTSDPSGSGGTEGPCVSWNGDPCGAYLFSLGIGLVGTWKRCGSMSSSFVKGNLNSSSAFDKVEPFLYSGEVLKSSRFRIFTIKNAEYFTILY